VSDAPACVADNRQTLALATGCQPVFVQQVHGQQVVELDSAGAELSSQVADAAVTRQRNLGCTIMVADCLPVLLAHLDEPVVAAAHAGWRGLAGEGSGSGLGQSAQLGAQPPASAGVLAAVFSRFSELAGQSPHQAAGRTIAWLGPCIGPAAFEVGAEVKAAFEAWHPDAGTCFVARPVQPPSASTPKYLADLAGLARLQLRALGITAVYGNDSSAGWCTVSQASRFFSHRRDAGGGRSTGRMAACIWQV
jgi:copper oxidase (laccase) domain-containing protein